MAHAADTNLSGTLCNGRGDRANAKSQKLSHGFAQFVILESESESESPFFADQWIEAGSGEWPVGGGSACVRAWLVNSFIDKACQATSILHLVGQLLMPLVAGLRVICGSCFGVCVTAAAVAVPAAVTEMRYIPAIGHL